ncbi:MAG: SCO family protein, partial [Comamonas sp.]
TPEEVAAVVKDFKFYYKKVPGKVEGSYTLDHSAGIYLYDTQGRLRVYERYGSGPQVLVQDVKALLP